MTVDDDNVNVIVTCTIHEMCDFKIVQVFNFLLKWVAMQIIASQTCTKDSIFYTVHNCMSTYIWIAI